MSEQNQQPDVTGSTDHPQHRAGGQGVDAPMAGAQPGETGEVQASVFDGAGNEVVTVVKENAEGVMSQGTGATADEARADAEKPGDLLGKGYGTAAH